MRSRGDVFEADGRSDAGSSRSEEEAGLVEKHRKDSTSRPGSQRSVKSSRNEELGEPNDGSDSSSSSQKPPRNINSNPIEYTDQERAELLKRLDSIKDHLLRGGGTKEPDLHLRPAHFHGPNPGKHVPGPSYYHPYPEPYPYGGPMHGMYPATSGPPHPPGYQDPYGYQMHRRSPPNPNWYPGHYPNQRTRPYPTGQYVDIGSDILESQSQDPMYHQYFPATPSRYSDMPPYSPVSHHHEKLTQFSPRINNFNSPSFPSTMGSPGPQGGYTKWPSDLDSEMGGAFARGYVQKAVSDTDARRCYPLAGGAPFIACHNCFELLYLPKKKLFAQERQQKLQCGACSEVISFTIVDKKLVFSSANEETNPVSVEVEDRSTNAVVSHAIQDSCEDVKQPDGKLSSNNSGSDFQPEEDAIQESRNHQETQSIRSASQHSDDEERSSVSSEQQREVKSVRRRAKDTKPQEPPRPDSSSLLELFEYSNVNRAALAYGMEQLGYKPNKQESYLKQDSQKPGSVATETEVSYNGYSNTEVSEDSRYSNGREEDNRPRSRKGSESGITEITTSSSTYEIEELDKSLEVWVNGRLIPEDLVSRAEKLAGPIQAGKYWYDYRAGFWGVMNKPCLGIIPPFIEEFSHPMPDNCAAGNTEVFVNGRELHRRDLELLVGRGLPRDKNRSYIVDIAGRVLDGDSGEELDSLGKLAPTIQKVKHGFGMRVPRSLAT